MTDEKILVSVDEYDLRDQAHKHQMEAKEKQYAAQEKHDRSVLKSDRQETIKWVGIAIVIALLIFGIATLIFFGTNGPDEGAGKEERREQACIAKGGGWVPQDMLATSSEGLCVFPGDGA